MDNRRLVVRVIVATIILVLVGALARIIGGAWQPPLFAAAMVLYIQAFRPWSRSRVQWFFISGSVGIATLVIEGYILYN
jgi:hypothetical protein